MHHGQGLDTGHDVEAGPDVDGLVGTYRGHGRRRGRHGQRAAGGLQTGQEVPDLLVPGVEDDHVVVVLQLSHLDELGL